MIMKKLVCCMIIGLVSYTSFSQTNSDKNILKMMDATGYTDIIKLTVDNIIRFKENESAVILDTLRWEDIKKNELNYDVFIESSIPIYKKNYTPKQIEKITAFFNTSEGKAYLSKTPKLNREVLKELTISVQNKFTEMNEAYRNPLSERFQNPAKGCTAIKSGSFSYLDNSGNEVKVTRSKNIQMEVVGDKLYTSKIEWTSDCEYKVWEYQEDNKYKGIPVYYITVYEINKDSYKCVFTKEGEDQYFESEIKILN